MKTSWTWNAFAYVQLTGKTFHPATFYAIKLLALFSYTMERHFSKLKLQVAVIFSLAKMGVAELYLL